MAESTEINGRIQSRQRVDLVARVTAFLNERLFDGRRRRQEGPVALSSGTGAFRSRRGGQGGCGRRRPEAQLENADLALARAQELLQKSSSEPRSRSTCALATQRVAAAQVKAAQAQLHQSQINLGLYRDPHRQSMAASVERRLRSEMSLVPPAARWRLSSVRIRCM